MPTSARFRVYGQHLVTLTTDHAMSSHGLPILLVDGDDRAYGPHDKVVIGRGRDASPPMHAGHFVKMGLNVGTSARRSGYNSPEAEDMAAAFLSQSHLYAKFAQSLERRRKRELCVHREPDGMHA